jgi:hypothetical protein
MPAKSQQQQKIMGLALAFKRGEVPASEVSDKVKSLAKSMTMKELEKYASTKHKDLPKKVKESRMNGMSSKLSTFEQFMREKDDDKEEIEGVDTEVETADDVDVELDMTDDITGDEEMINVRSSSPMKPIKNKHSFEWSEPESKMMQYQLKNIIENAEELIQMIEGVEEIEDWVQSKVTLADDYLSTLRDYMKHRD